MPPPTAAATCTSTCGPGPSTAPSPTSRSTTWSRAEDADPRGKRDPRDFALWKGRKADEPESASWPTPFGAGRPGWHLECSAMARRWLGDEFDIHGGGIDLRFPHHENEQAQSRAAGLGFARYWLHNAWVTVKGQKMGKSLGNALEVRHLLEATRPIVLRYYLTAAHYRSMIEYHPGSLDEAGAAVERIEGFLERASRRGRSSRAPPSSCPQRSSRRWTTTSASAARSPSSTTPCAPATALSTTDDDEAALEAAACRRGDDRRARRQPARRRTGAPAAAARPPRPSPRSTRSSVPSSTRGRRRGRSATSSAPTRSATRSPPSASRSPTRRRGPSGRSRARPPTTRLHERGPRGREGKG